MKKTGATMPPKNRRGGEQGFVLVMTLIMLAVITLASMSMMITTRAGISTSGNIAFRQAAVRVADVAAESALTWMTANQASLNNTNVAAGYYSKHDQVAGGCSATAAFSPVTYDFGSTGCACKSGNGNCPLNIVDSAAVAGYSLAYVVHRMAQTAETACPAADCATPRDDVMTQLNLQGISQLADNPFKGPPAVTAVNNKVVYYRITIKVAGPRRNNRFVQVFVY